MRSIMPSELRALLSLTIAACFIGPLLFFATAGTSAETFVFDGTAGSRVHMTVTTTIHISGIDPEHIANDSKFVYNATYPASSPADVSGYSASYSNVQIDVSPAPSGLPVTVTDQYDNQYTQYEWDVDNTLGSSFDIAVTTSFDAITAGDLSPLSFDDPIGTSAYPEFRSPTSMVQSGAPSIINKKNDLLRGATSEAEAVDRVMDYVKKNIPEQDANVPKDAVSSMKSRKGNCVNRAHLAMALLRSANIPVRCVSGVLYADKYTVSYPYGGGTASTDITWGSGSHVWIEVYYPQENAWVAYDPWMEKGFVDSRHVRFAVGKDFDTNPSTRGSAGLLAVVGLSPTVNMGTAVSATNLQDSINIHYRYAEDSPVGTFMMGRVVQSSRAPTATPTPSPTIMPNNSTVTITPLPGEPTITVTPMPGVGDAPRFNLSGSIIDRNTGTPVKGATVMLDSIELSANSTGRFLFLNALSGSTYNLTVSAPGYETDARAIAPNGDDMDVTIILKAEKASSPPSSPWNPLPGPDMLVAIAALAGGAFLWRSKRP